jgi:hypothetical protein
MKKVAFLLLIFVVFASTSLFASTTFTNGCKSKCQKTATKDTVVVKKSVLELAKKAAQVSSSQKEVFPDFIIGTTFYKF